MAELAADADSIADSVLDGFSDGSDGPRAAASIDGDAAADVNEGMENSFFSLHQASVGISFGAVAAFLIALFVTWACFKSNCCGIFNCCMVCKPRSNSTAHPAPGGPAPVAWGPPPPAYNPYSTIGPSSASSIYGTDFGQTPPTASGRITRGTRPALLHHTRERSPSGVSRIFLAAKKDAVRYSNTDRFHEIPAE